ncbi:sterol desaturase family protein [Cognatiyoonia sp. IB215446]|uniref:sterol desaturase family protein n=1 Tax=Cognatiyoonia sp. IB215446 TaxID=3097355 RepID=UPI002A1835B1|nr:sterol desaturase family protein [Cognatiyoonia sp. IB215446]MDX8348095.1 sterol desaturase family protein [Cognatiyoonia sp. IB215446]
MNVETLTTQIDEVFFLIGVAILLIEIAEMAFRGEFRAKTFGEMLTSASTQLPYLLVETFILTGAYGLYWVIAQGMPWSVPVTWWSLLLIVILADLTYYWEHRIAHEVRILWTQHAVHHSSRDMNIVTGVRFGPLEGVWSLIAHLPLAFIGFAPEAIVFGVIVVLAYQTWIHTELIGKLGPLEWVLNTPSHHRVHHGCDDKYLDKNYGGILIIWDRLWGTFQEEEETPRYGLKRDFDTRNPIKVWFSEWPELIRDVRRAQSLGQVWSILLRAPGHASKD